MIRIASNGSKLNRQPLSSRKRRAVTHAARLFPSTNPWLKYQAVGISRCKVGSIGIARGREVDRTAESRVDQAKVPYAFGSAVLSELTVMHRKDDVQ